MKDKQKTYGTCLYCDLPIQYGYFGEEWYHPSLVTSDNGGCSCKDKKHVATPKDK